MSHLRVAHLSKWFTGADGAPHQVLGDVSLEMQAGEFVATIGHSGCGKSTLLNIIAGFEKASTGAVEVDGKPVTRPGLDRMVVFQGFSLLPWLTAYGNVMVAVRAAHPDWSRTQIRQHSERFLALMNLTSAADKRPTHLSGGMRQRVGLARAFAVEPRVLLLDEPFAQIDALTRGVIQEELIRMWNATRATVFLVTHDVDEAILLSDRILLMTNGPAAQIAMEIPIDIPRPRSRKTIIDLPEYTRLRNRILHFLMEQDERAKQPVPALATS